MFFGMWEAEASAAPGGWFSGRPELAVGHYGTELTGVVRFLDDNALPTLPCRCAFLEHQRVDLAAASFVAISEQCDDTLWIWDLALTEDDPPRLVGTVTRASDTSDEVAVSFRLLDTFVPDERRECVR